MCGPDISFVVSDAYIFRFNCCLQVVLVHLGDIVDGGKANFAQEAFRVVRHEEVPYWHQFDPLRVVVCDDVGQLEQVTVPAGA